MSEEEQKVIEILEKRGNLQINTLVVEADIPVQKMNTILFELEMKGVVRVLVGECTSYYSNFLIICILYIVEKQKPFRIFGKISKVQ